MVRDAPSGKPADIATPGRSAFLTRISQLASQHPSKFRQLSDNIKKKHPNIICLQVWQAFLSLKLIQAVIESLLLHERIVAAAFDDAAAMQDHDAIGVAGC